MNYKVGDIVICIDNEGVHNELEVGAKYTIKEISFSHLVVEPIKNEDKLLDIFYNWYYKKRFIFNCANYPKSLIED